MGPSFSGFSEGEWKQWSEALSGLVIRAVRAALMESRSLSGALQSKRIDIPLDRLLVNAPKDRSVSFQCVSVGQHLRILGISAEAVVGYDSVAQSAFPDAIVIPVGYVDDVFGYLPTESMVEEGGYEADGFLRYFSLTGPWSRKFECECLNTLRSLAD